MEFGLFEIKIEIRKKVPSMVFVGFIESKEIDDQSQDNSLSDWLPAPYILCRLGIDRYIDLYFNRDFPKIHFPGEYYRIGIFC